MSTGKLGGFKIRIGQYQFRIWKTDFELGNRFGGRVFFFPWHPLKHKK